jgi:hypothetical protein
MNAVGFVLLWLTGGVATFLYLFRYVNVTPTSLIALASWAILAIDGGRVTWMSNGEPVALDGRGGMQALCAFLALVSGFIFVAHRNESYPTDDMLDDSDNPTTNE